MTDQQVSSMIAQGKAAQLAGRWDEARACYEAALRELPAEDAATRAEVLRALGRLFSDRGDRDAAAAQYEAALDVAERAGLRQHVASALNALATVEQFRGDLPRAEALYGEARRIAQELGDDARAALVDQNLGILANIRGNFATALGCYNSALTRYRRVANDAAASGVLNNLGMLHVDREDFEQAERCFEEALALATTSGGVNLTAWVELNRAELDLKRRRFEHARHTCDRALSTFSRLGSKPGQGEAYKFFGVLFRETSRGELAELHFGLALKMADGASDPLLKAETLREWAIVHLVERRSREAVKLLNESHRLFCMLGARHDVLDIERRMRRLDKPYVEAAASWGSELLRSKGDDYTAEHCGRVADYACRLGEAMGLGSSELARLRVGALVHDVGKTRVPRAVLDKPGALDRDEMALVQQHAALGEEMVADLGFPSEVKAMVRGHHERWDGRGYPDRRRGDEVDVPTRILRVADVYDSVTSDRCYQRGKSHDEAMHILGVEAGRSLDPEMVTCFKEVMQDSQQFALAYAA